MKTEQYRSKMVGQRERDRLARGGGGRRVGGGGWGEEGGGRGVGGGGWGEVFPISF